MEAQYSGFSLLYVDSSTYTTYQTEWKGAKSIPVDDEALTILDQKIDYGSEIYGMIVTETDANWQIAFISEKVTLEGAFSAFAEATFASALALLAIASF